MADEDEILSAAKDYKKGHHHCHAERSESFLSSGVQVLPLRLAQGFGSRAQHDTGRSLRLMPIGDPQEFPYLTAVAVAFALGTVSGADRSHWTAPAGDTRAAQADNPVHMAEVVAAVLLAVVAGNRAAAVAAR